MIKTLFWAFVLLLALSFFGISVRSIIMSPAGQENFGFAAYWLAFAWHSIVEYVHTLAKAFS